MTTLSMSGSDGKCRLGSEALRCGKWELTMDPNLKEDTNSESGKVVHYSPVKKSYQLEIDVYCAAAKLAEDVGVVEGAEVLMDLRVGTGPKGYIDWTFIVGPIKVTGCDQDGLVQFHATMFAQEAKPSLTDYS